MKITHINTYDIAGGAARAAYRLHQGLLKIGHSSQIITKEKTSQDSTVIEVDFFELENNPNFVEHYYIQKHYINNNRTSLTNTLFSLSSLGLNLAKLPMIQDTDIINLHWIANNFQCPITIKNLLALGKPMVWTLHDMNAFTGGCHYSAGCEKYHIDCLNCPQLNNDTYNLSYHILQDKIQLINHPNLTIVTPSKWLADCAKKSALFHNNNIKVIPYGLDTNIFIPTPKSEAKKGLNIPENTIIILIGAVSGKEQRKGFSELIKVLKICQKHYLFSQLFINQQLKIAYFGEPSDDFQELELEFLPFGIINSDRQLSLIYSAADIFILPSLEDNLPNTMLESMACGTPVIGFDTGGIPDVVKNEITGFIIAKNDAQNMAEKIMTLIENQLLRENLSRKCRELIVNYYSLSHQANNYVELYQTLIKNNHIFKKSPELNINNDVSLGSNFKKIYPHIALYSLHEEIRELNNIVNYKNNDIEQLHIVIKNKDTHIKNTEELVKQINDNLHNKDEEINEYKKIIEEMKKSKFWLWRNKWLKLKKILSPKDNN